MSDFWKDLKIVRSWNRKGSVEGNVPVMANFPKIKFERHWFHGKPSPKIIQVGNLVDSGEGFSNPQRGRVYSPGGIAPTVCCKSGGGRRGESFSWIRQEQGQERLCEKSTL